MVFSTLIFIYGFLPMCFVFYTLSRTIRAKNIVLLVFSLIFYAWTDPRYLLLLTGMALVNYLCARCIGSCWDRKQKKAILAVACGASLGLLGVFKYTDMILGLVKQLTGFPQSLPGIVLPIGISFYTFQLLSYTIDVYRGEVEAERNFGVVLLYAGLFHQCIAGPIIRYQDVAEEIHDRTVRGQELSDGITRFAVGLAKKTLLANSCAKIVDLLIPASQAGVEATSAAGLWVGMLCYMLQIYLDFSAYSDMAIGMGLMMGFHYKENFNYPYIANSVQDFWRRWHISLSTFFRDYVYIPLGGNRVGQIRLFWNLFVVWFLTGLWHGASWNFVLWGLYYFVFLVMERLFLGGVLRRIPALVGHIYTLLVVFGGWILFKFTDTGMLAAVAKGLFCGNGNRFTDFETKTVMMNNVFLILVCILAVTPAAKWVGECLEELAGRKRYALYVKSALDMALPVLFLLLSTMALVGNSYNPFLYTQF